MKSQEEQSLNIGVTKQRPHATDKGEKAQSRVLETVLITDADVFFRCQDPRKSHSHVGAGRGLLSRSVKYS